MKKRGTRGEGEGAQKKKKKTKKKDKKRQKKKKTKKTRGVVFDRGRKIRRKKKEF
jgi:hypothetical protein